MDAGGADRAGGCRDSGERVARERVRARGDERIGEHPQAHMDSGKRPRGFQALALLSSIKIEILLRAAVAAEAVVVA